jgi:putative transposase
MTHSSSPSDTESEHLKCNPSPIQTRGRPRSHSLRVILDAIFYLPGLDALGAPFHVTSRLGKTVYYHFHRFRLSGMWHRILASFRTAERQRVSRDTRPTAATMDAQSKKTVEESAPISGYDGHKNVKGRKRHLLVDNLGLPPSVCVTPADIQDRAGARCLLETVGLGSFTAIPLRTGRGMLVCKMVNYRKLVVLQDKPGKNERNGGTFS